jgi:hypothetical protein
LKVLSDRPPVPGPLPRPPVPGPRPQPTPPPKPAAPRVNTSTLAGVQRASQPAPQPAPRPAPQPVSSSSRPPTISADKDYRSPYQDAINRRLAKDPNHMFGLRDPEKESSGFTGWVKNLFEPRVPRPMEIPITGKQASNPDNLDVFGNPIPLKIDDQIFSLRHRAMAPPPVSIQDQLAAYGVSFPAMKNGEEVLRYPALERDEWGRIVRIPGEYLEEKSPLTWRRASNSPRLVPLPVTPEALEARPRPSWWYSDESPYPPSQ